MNLDDADAMLVLADQLTQKGDPRGELISLHIQLEKAKGAKRRQLDLAAMALEEKLLPREAGEDRVELVWRRGWLRSIRSSGHEEIDRNTDVKILRALLSHPSAAHLVELGVGDIEGDDDLDYAPVAKLIAKLAPKSLRRLFIGCDEWQWSWAVVTVSALSGKLPQLESLTVVGGNPDLGKADFPGLVELACKTGNGDPANVVAIGKRTYPKLERLEVWFGQEDAGASGSPASCRGILDGKGLPKLRHLGICNTEFTDALVPAILQAPILKRLKTLDLSKGTLTDEGLRALVAGAARIKHLESINLDENCIATPRLAKQLGVKTSVKDQKDPEDERYASVGE